MLIIKSEVQVQTKLKGEGTRINTIVESAEHLRINSVILGDGEHIGGAQIDTAVHALPVAPVQEVDKAVTQRDVVTLEERCVANKVVAHHLVIGRPAIGHCLRNHVLQVAKGAVIALRNVGVTGATVPVNIVVKAGTKAETKVPNLELQARAQTSSVGSSRALVEVQIGIRDLTVGIAIDKDTLKWLAVLAIHLLINIE